MTDLRKGTKVNVCCNNDRSGAVIREEAVIVTVDWHYKPPRAYCAGKTFGFWLDLDKGPEWPIWIEERD